MSTAVASFRLKTIATIVHSVANFLLIRYIVLGPLGQDAVSMAHRDPVDIIAEPFPLRPLFILTTVSVILSLAISTGVAIADTRTRFHDSADSTTTAPSTQPSSMRSLIEATRSLVFFSLVVFAFSVLSGASPAKDVHRTALSSLYLAALAFAPSFACPNFFPFPENFVRIVVGSDFAGDDTAVKLTPSERVNRLGMYGTIVATIPSMILLILDWGSQVQRWPVPVLLGSSVGFAAGSLIGIVLGWKGVCFGSEPQVRLADGGMKSL